MAQNRRSTLGRKNRSTHLAARTQADSLRDRKRPERRDAPRNNQEGASIRETSNSSEPDALIALERLGYSSVILTKDRVLRILEACFQSCVQSDSAPGLLATRGPAKDGTFDLILHVHFPPWKLSPYSSLLGVIENVKHSISCASYLSTVRPDSGKDAGISFSSKNSSEEKR